MATIPINGTKLRTVLGEYGMRQLKLADAISCSHYNVSRWCASGIHQIKRSNVIGIAKALGIPLNVLLEKTAEYPSLPGQETLTPSELACLKMYRSLSPLDQATMLVQLSKLAKQS